jgi:hypothetical protein
MSAHAMLFRFNHYRDHLSWRIHRPALVIAKRLCQLNTKFAFTSYCRATTETDAPGASEAAMISRLSASGQDRLRRRPLLFVSITAFVDTSHLHNAKDHITRETWSHDCLLNPHVQR